MPSPFSLDPTDRDDDYGDVDDGAHPRHPGRAFPPNYPRFDGPITTWAGLRPDATDPLWWVTTPMRLFRPEGLIVTDAPRGALLHEWRTGAQLDLPAGAEPLALSTFRWLERSDPLGIGKKPRPRFSTLELGMTLRLKVSTVDGAPLPPTVGLTVWGKAT